MKSTPRAIKACSDIAAHLLKSTTLGGLFQGFAIMGIVDHLRRDEVRNMSDTIGFNSEDFTKYTDMSIANDPEFRKIEVYNALRYVQVDGIKQNKIHFGLIDNSVEKPRRITPISADN